jgi:hypothetical protein
MQLRRRFKEFLSLNDRLELFSAKLKAAAAKLRPSPQRDELLKRAGIAETAAHINQWVNSPGLRSPK